MHGRPSVEQIRSQVRGAERYWAAWRDQAEQDFRLCAHGPNVVIFSASKEELANINPTTAKDVVDAVTNHLIANFPTITVDKRAFPESEAGKADTLEGGLQAVFSRATEGVADDPHRGSVQTAAGMGMGVIEIAIDFSGRPEKPEDDADEVARREYAWRYKNFFPVTLRPVDPRQVLPDPGTSGRQWVARQSRLTVGEVKATFSTWEPATGTAYDDADEVDVLHWVSDRWYYYEIEGLPVLLTDALDPDAVENGEDLTTPKAGPWVNPLGFIPYVVYPSGYGMSVGTPEQRFMSLITAARHGRLFEAEARRMGQLDAIVGKMAWGALIGPPGLADIDLSPGTYNEVTPNMDGSIPEPKVIGFVNPPTGVFAELSRIQSAIERSTIPDILTTGESGSAESALKFVRKTQEALVGLNPLKRNVERAWAEVFRRLIIFFDNPRFFGKNESVYVWGRSPKGPVQATLGPALIEGRHVPVFVEIRPALPEDEALRVQTGAALLGRGLALEDFYDRFMRIDDPQAMARRFRKDQVIQQTIETGVVARYIAALMAGQANPLQGIAGFIQAQATGMGAAPVGPEQAPGAVEPTADVATPQPSQAGATAQNPAMLDMQGMLQRALLQRSAAKPAA